MQSTREARTIIKTTTSVPKQNDSSSLSARIQAWQASVDSRQKHTQSSIARTSSTMIGSHEFSRADSIGDSESVGESHISSCYSSDNESVRDSVEVPNGNHTRPSINTRKHLQTALVVSKPLLGSSTISNSTELGEIQQSVHCLRAQRTHVERLSQRNEELERRFAELKAENETLQREVLTLRGAEQENVAYLESVKLLEQRARKLEETCTKKKLELRTAIKNLSCVEQERDEFREEIQNSRHDHEDEVKVLRDKHKKLLGRIEQLEQANGAQIDDRNRMEHHWKQKLQAAAHANSQTIDSLQQQLEQSCEKASKLETEVRDLEKQVKNFVATTVRQTTVIEECDRMLSESEAHQQLTQRKYEEQVQLTRELSAKTQRLEVQIASLKQSKKSETIELEKKVLQLENELAQRKDQLQAVEETLRNKDKEIEVIQRAYATRDDNRLHLDEVNKELQRKERKLKSDISELQIALRDATDEKYLLSEQVLELQEQLEGERKDRSRWATTRLKLLAEFCDEGSKLSPALNHHNDTSTSLDDRRQKQSTPSQRTKNRRVTKSRASEDQRYASNESEKEDEQSRNSIVFG